MCTESKYKVGSNGPFIKRKINQYKKGCTVWLLRNIWQMNEYAGEKESRSAETLHRDTSRMKK